MAFDDLSALIDKIRLLEAEESPTEEVVVEEVVTNPEEALHAFINSLTESDEGVASFGPYKIYYEGDDHNFLIESEDEKLQRFVNKEGITLPSEYGYLNEGKVFYTIFVEDSDMRYAAEKTPKINPYGGMKDRQFRGAISEMPDTSGPVGTQPGGWRTYRPKPAGEIDETASTGQGGGSAGNGGGQMVGGPTTYEQENDMFKRRGPRRITAMTYEDTGAQTITLNQLYGDNKPDRDDAIWDYGTAIWNTPYEIQAIGSHKLDMQLCAQYGVEHIEELFDRMGPDQHEIVDRYINDPNLSNKIIVLDNGHIVDGNHRAIAAALTKRPIKFVDIGEEQDI